MTDVLYKYISHFVLKETEMAYNHDIFKEIWQSKTAVYPFLLNHYKECADLVHLSIKKKSGRRLSNNATLTIINECMVEMGIFEGRDAYRTFAAAYHGIMGNLIKHGRHWRSQQTGPKQIRLPI